MKLKPTELDTLTACIINDQYEIGVTSLFFSAGYNVIEINNNFITELPLTDSQSDSLQIVLQNLKHVDLLVFCAGSDINTKIYGQERSKLTDKPERIRDLFEIVVWKEGRRLAIPMVGIDRGAQLLNCLSGGSLNQHVLNHFCGHNISTVEEDTTMSMDMMAPSSHHQVMLPSDNAEVLAIDKSSKAAEVVLYPTTRSLCHQPHPEWNIKASIAKAYRDYFFSTVLDLVKSKEV